MASPITKTESYKRTVTHPSRVSADQDWLDAERDDCGGESGPRAGRLRGSVYLHPDGCGFSTNVSTGKPSPGLTTRTTS